MPQSKRDEDTDSVDTWDLQQHSETPTLARPGRLGKENKLKQKINTGSRRQEVPKLFYGD